MPQPGYALNFHPKQCVTGIPKLKTLDLSNNSITAIRRNFFERLGELNNLDCADNLIATVQAQAFVGNRKLMTLNLEGNRIYSLHDDVFKGIL